MNKKANGQKTTAIVLIIILLLVLGLVIFYVSMQKNVAVSKTQTSQESSDQSQDVQYVVKKLSTKQETCFGDSCNFPQIKTTNPDSNNSGSNGIGGVIVCRKDADCSDGDEGTIDVCVNAGTIKSACTYHTPQCSDLVDNDGDGNVDFPADADCSSKLDDSESQ